MLSSGVPHRSLNATATAIQRKSMPPGSTMPLWGHLAQRRHLAPVAVVPPSYMLGGLNLNGAGRVRGPRRPFSASSPLAPCSLPERVFLFGAPPHEERKPRASARRRELGGRSAGICSARPSVPKCGMLDGRMDRSKQNSGVSNGGQLTGLKRAVGLCWPVGACYELAEPPDFIILRPFCPVAVCI